MEGKAAPTLPLPAHKLPALPCTPWEQRVRLPVKWCKCSFLPPLCGSRTHHVPAGLGVWSNYQWSTGLIRLLFTSVSACSLGSLGRCWHVRNISQDFSAPVSAVLSCDNAWERVTAGWQNGAGFTVDVGVSVSSVSVKTQFQIQWSWVNPQHLPRRNLRQLIPLVFFPAWNCPPLHFDCLKHCFSLFS